MNDDDMDALAAEYVLGTLDGEERTRAHVLLDVDHGFRGVVRIWERRLGELHLMVEPVEPPSQIWERIKAKLEEVEPGQEIKLSEVVPQPEPVPPTATEPSSSETQSPGFPLSEVKSSEATLPKAATLEPAAPESAAPELIASDRVARGPSPVVPTAAGRREMVEEVPQRRAGGGWVLAITMALVAVSLAGLIAAWRFVPERLPSLLRATTVLKIPQAPQMPARKPLPPGSQFDE